MIKRFQILIGTKGYYIYDYKLFDVVKKDDAFFITEDEKEAKDFLSSLTQEFFIRDEKGKGVWK